MDILIAIDDSPRSTAVIQFGALFARPAAARVTLLGVAPTSATQAPLRAALEAAREAYFQGSGCEVAIAMRAGAAEEEILAQSHEHFYQLVIIGWYQRRGISRFILGSVARYLGQHVPASLLVVSDPRPLVQRMLICTSGEVPGELHARIGGNLAALVGAEVTVLHVMSQLALIPDAPFEDLERDAPDLIRQGTREGRHLQRVLDILGEVGVPPERRHARVRHGLVLDEIIREAREGDYDLVVTGAHGVPPSRRWARLRALLQENITDHILTHIRRPVLIARALSEEEWAAATESAVPRSARRPRRINVGE